MLIRPIERALFLRGVYVVFCLVVGLILATSRQYVHDQTLVQQGEWLQTLTRVIDKTVSNQLVLTGHALRDLRSGLYSNPGDLGQLADTLPGIKSLLVADRSGKIVTSDRPDLVGRTLAEGQDLQRLKTFLGRNRLSISLKPELNRGVPVLMAEQAIVNRQGEFEGLVRASFDQKYYQTLLDSVRHGPLAWARLYQGSGNVYVEVADGANFVGLRSTSESSDIRQFLAKADETWLRTVSRAEVGEIPRQSAFRLIRPTGLTLGSPLVVEVGLDLRPRLAGWGSEFVILGLLYLGCSVSGFVLLSLYFRRQRVQSAESHAKSELLHESSLRFQLATEAARLGVWEWRADTDNLIWDHKMFELYGIEQEGFVPVMASWDNLLLKEDRQKATEQLQSGVESGSPTVRLFRIAVGVSVRWIQCTSQYLDARGDRPARFIGFNEEVTQRLEGALAVAESERFLRTLTESLPTQVAYYSADLVCGFANSKYASSHNSSPERIMGNSFQHLLGWELYQRRKPSIEEALAGNPVEIEDTFESSPGVINHLWIHYIPNIRNGVTEGFFVLVDDIRELKVTQTQLEAQQGRLILNARMAQMGEMLSLIAHQWRQPLTVVSVLVGNIQLKSQLGGLDVDYLMPKLDKINQTVHSLSGTIESFRSFYAPTKTKEDSDLLEVTSKALEFLSPVLRKQSLEVRYDPPSSPVFSWVLRAELMQVIVEILTNAVFALTPKGGWISLEWTVGTSEANLAIANNGGAIPEMDLPKIFLPDFTTKTDGSGTGLGLYMARVIIESHHGGRLNAEVANDITTFRITLPLEETRK